MTRLGVALSSLSCVEDEGSVTVQTMSPSTVDQTRHCPLGATATATPKRVLLINNSAYFKRRGHHRLLTQITGRRSML